MPCRRTIVCLSHSWFYIQHISAAVHAQAGFHLASAVHRIHLQPLKELLALLCFYVV